VAVWRIPSPDIKNAKEHRIHLSDFALERFQLLREITDGSDWCLPARDGKKHIGTKSIAKQIKDRQRSG
jgi:integrase